MRALISGIRPLRPGMLGIPPIKNMLLLFGPVPPLLLSSIIYLLAYIIIISNQNPGLAKLLFTNISLLDMNKYFK